MITNDIDAVIETVESDPTGITEDITSNLTQNTPSPITPSTPPPTSYCQDINKELLQQLRERFLRNINDISKDEPHQRKYYTRVEKKPREEELKLIDKISAEYIESVKEQREVTFIDLNIALYSAAVTIKQHINDM